MTIFCHSPVVTTCLGTGWKSKRLPLRAVAAVGEMAYFIHAQLRTEQPKRRIGLVRLHQPLFGSIRGIPQGATPGLVTTVPTFSFAFLFPRASRRIIVG